MADLNARQQTLEFLKGQNAARLAAGLLPIGVGIDMSTGRQVTDQNYLQKIFGLNQGELIPTPDLAQMAIDSQAEVDAALTKKAEAGKEPDKTITQQAEDIVKAAQIIAPIDRQLSQQRIGDLFGLAQAMVPLSLAAAQAATDRNLAASKEFLATREKMPSTQQMIAASRQGQMTDAARAFATEAAAIAGQQDAASRFASLGTMRRYGR